MAIEKNFLQLEFGSGLFFDYNKEPKEGYEEHTSTKGNKSYRKYYKEGVSGVLESVSLYESKFGTQISMNVKDGDNVYYLPVAVLDQGDNVDDNFAESLIKLLPLLNKGDIVKVSGYNFIPKGDQYSKIGMSITVNGEKLKSKLTNAYYKKLKDSTGEYVKDEKGQYKKEFVGGDIPALDWQINKLGKNKPTAVSQEAKNNYLLDLVTLETNRLQYIQGEQTTSTPAPQAPVNKTPEQAFAPATNLNQKEPTDLPFK
ncbi:MAG TPA: hypothetical protein VLA48_03045 [Nitrososphaeraceae archaeon]|nr:hypothetical protein [Nitrososphaeraceae archaeon]